MQRIWGFRSRLSSTSLPHAESSGLVCSRATTNCGGATRSRDRDGIGRSPLSFYVEFTAASHDDALRIVLAEEFLPDSVRTFVCQALEAYRAARAIYVKAVGHLYSKDFEVSSAEIVVREIKLRQPKSG